MAPSCDVTHLSLPHITCVGEREEGANEQLRYRHTAATRNAFCPYDDGAQAVDRFAREKERQTDTKILRRSRAAKKGPCSNPRCDAKPPCVRQQQQLLPGETFCWLSRQAFVFVLSFSSSFSFLPTELPFLEPAVNIN